MTKPLAPTDDLMEQKPVPFEKLFLDPNNPRIAQEHPPGYDDPTGLFDIEHQAHLEKRVRAAYTGVDALQDSIIKQGWIPIDPIIVWEHPKRKGFYVVVEGNTRTVALRYLRGERLDQEKKALEKLKKSSSPAQHIVQAQEEVVRSLEAVRAATDNLKVFPLAAGSVEELQQKLPRLLGVRHIAHAQQWQPYATNLYILSLYEKLYRETYSDGRKLTLEPQLVKRVADMVSRKELTTRRNMQAAAAFTDFKRKFEHRLPEGESFQDADQYYFEQILQSRFTQDQFEFGKDALDLPDERAEVLFQWAFSKPRDRSGTDDDADENVFYKAESVGLWSKMNNYDVRKGTPFSKMLNVDAPEEAPSIRVVEAQYLAHKARRSAVDTLDSLRTALQELKGDALLSQQEHLEPMLEEIVSVASKYVKMMKAVTS
ncbi:hypothetical protein ACFPOE_01980 [Caenimonas terrae]|uniref:ParB/Sulfiredoxin domain-containing protein n=1 Tax=Caenimonas terrae TaxID=696074 RepID=A0ABW0NBE6_9BURK